MVDVGAKDSTPRRAVAVTKVSMQPATLQLITNRQVAKGDVFEVARLAGIMGAKRTSDLIPLCHSLGLDSVEIHYTILDGTTIEIRLATEVPRLRALFAEEPALSHIQIDHLLITAQVSGNHADQAALLARLIAAGLPVCHFAARARNLEDLFLHVTEGRVQ